MLTGSEIRRKFLDFFVQKGHKEVHSSSLVPANDPTLLFTNAGMNQFKDVFLGLEKRNYSRATTSQKCVRAGGKHNDLENVGFTNRHHTFFEMLGNFSFGDYFKKDAIAYAWELITSPEWFGIDKNKLYVTVFNGEGGVPRDSEAHDLWVAQGVPKERIFELGAKDNFWQMGDTGPCGPCSEIHYDMGPAASDQGHTDCAFTCDCGRFVEIWNLVFMQFDRDASGKLNPLPKPSIDTGMGLERVASVLQGVISNYDTDLFTPLIKRAAELTGTSLKKELDKEAHTKSAASLRVIADHSRAAAFLISDGVLPSNEGRGYVLRKIIRRAITHGRLLGQTKPFLNEMVFAVRDLMQDAYPELKETAERIAKAVLTEENRFSRTLEIALDKLAEDFRQARNTRAHGIRNYLEDKASAGIEISEEHVRALDAEKRLANDPLMLAAQISEVFGYELAPQVIEELRAMLRSNPSLDGAEAFYLYETYGVPLDFMTDTARDQGIDIDLAGFEQARETERARARASWKGAAKQTANPTYQNLPRSDFEGYRQTRSSNCEVLVLLKGQGQGLIRPGNIGDVVSVGALGIGDVGEVILDHTPFYAESGGQVGDKGRLTDSHGNVVAEVEACYAPVQGVRSHMVLVKQPIHVGDKLDAVVNASIREATMRNHTATHLLQAGLREVLGKHVKQAGSLVAPKHLRFDFSHFTGVEDEELQDIEDLINKEVLRNMKVEVIPDVPIDVAVNEYKAMALFGEKYGERVRVIKIGDFSTELCGGTHTAATGEIGLIKILKEGSVSSGVRRIEAVTGEGSLEHFRKDHELGTIVAGFSSKETLQNPAEALRLELEKKDAEIKRLARELDQVRMKSASLEIANIEDKIKDVHGVKVLIHRVDNLERPQMRTLIDQLRAKIGDRGVAVLGVVNADKVSINVAVSTPFSEAVPAGAVIKPVAQRVGGKGGGGRPDLAEAGGKDPSALDAALIETYGVIEKLIPVYKRIQRKQVESNSIASIGYDPETKILELEFKGSGDIYRYYDVPTNEYEAFMSAPSKGTYLNQQFKKAGYRYERIVT